MGLLKFGVCVVTWILCASKSSGNNTTLLNSETECIEGQDLPSVGPCNKCICTQGKVFCINMECGLESKQNETRAGLESNSLHEKTSPSEKVFNETRRHRIDVINKKSNNSGLPHISSVITVEKTDEESPTISMILTKTHVDNTFKTFLRNSYDTDKYILIIPEKSNSEKKHLQKRDVSLIPQIWKNNLQSELGQQPSRHVNLGVYRKDNSKWRDNILANKTRREDSQQAFKFGNKNSKRPRQALRNNQFYNQQKMLSSQFKKKQISEQHNMVSSHLEKKRSDHYQMSQSQISKQHKMVSSHLKKSSDHYQMSHSESKVSKQHKMVSSHMKKKSDHYQMSQSHAQKKSSKFKFSYKAQSQSQYSGNSFQATRVTRAPNIKMHTPDEPSPFPQSKYVQPNQHGFKKPDNKLKQPFSDYDPNHLIPDTKNKPIFSQPGMKYPQTFNKPGHKKPVENINKNPFGIYPQTPKNKHKLRPKRPKSKPIKALIPHKPIKIIKPHNPKSKLNRVPQILIDITAIYPDIENTNTPQSKIPFGKIPKKMYGEPETYTDNNNEPLNKQKKYPKQSYPKNHYPEDEDSKPYQNRNKRLTTKVPKISFDDPQDDENEPFAKNRLPPHKKPTTKLMGLGHYSSQEIIDDELDIYHEDYLTSKNSLHKKSTPKMPLEEDTKLNPYQPKFKEAGDPHFNPKINPDYDNESKPDDDPLTHKKSKKSKMNKMLSLILDLMSKKKKPKQPNDKSEMYPNYNDSLEPNDKSPTSESPFYPTKPNYSLPKKNPNKPKQPDDYSTGDFNDKEEMDLDYENYDYTLTHKSTTTINPFHSNKLNDPNVKKPHTLKPTPKISPHKPKRPDESEKYPDDENYPDSNPLAPFFPKKGKKPKGKIPPSLKPLLDKFPFKPKLPDDSNPDSDQSDKPKMYPGDENYPDSNPLAPIFPKKGKKPKGKIPPSLKPLLDKFPFKPKLPDDSDPDSDQSDKPKMYPGDENYPDSNPLAPFFPKKGKKPKGKIPPSLKPLLDKFPFKPKLPDDSYPDSDQSDKPKMYPGDENYPDNDQLAPFYPTKGKKPKDKIPQFLKPLLDKFPYKPKRPDDSHPDSHYPGESEMYPDDDSYPTPDNHPSAPFLPQKGKKPKGKIPPSLKPLIDKFPFKPKLPYDSNPDSDQSDKPKMYPDDENYPDSNPLAPFFPQKGKKPKGKIPPFLKPSPNKSPYKPNRPNDSNPDSDQSDEPKLYPVDKNYPDNDQLAPFDPNKGKKPKDKIPQILKPLLDKFPYKPKRPDDSHPDYPQLGEPEKYPDDGNYPDSNPLAPFYPNKGKKPKDKIPQLLKPLLDKSPYNPKRPDDSHPDSHYPNEPGMYPDDENYPDNDQLAPFYPNKGKKHKDKIPQLLKPLLDKFPYKPKRPDDSHPDSHYPNEPGKYPDDENYPDNDQSAPFYPNKGKKPKDKLPQSLKPLLNKSPYKPKRPDDSNPDYYQPDDPEKYPDDENYPDSNPLAPYSPKKGKKPTSKIPQLLKPLLDKLPHKPKRPDGSNPDNYQPGEPDKYPDDDNYPDSNPLAPFYPNKGKKPKDKIPQLLKPLLDKFPYKPKRPDDTHPDYPQLGEPEKYPDDENYPDSNSLAPFYPNKGKKPKDKIPQILKPLLDKSPYKRPDDSNLDSHYPNEPGMYPDDENYPDNDQLAPFYPNKGKKPKDKIPQSLKPLLNKSPYKPKRPDDSNPDYYQPDDPEKYPDDENYPDSNPLAPFSPKKGKKPTGKIPQLLKPLLDKFPYKPKRPDNADPDYPQLGEPEKYPVNGNYPDSNPLAPFYPNKGKKPKDKIPQLLKPLLDKSPYKPKQPDGTHPDYHQPGEPEKYPDDENYPDRNPLAPFFPNKGKKPKDKIPQLLKPLLDKSPYKPKQPDGTYPDYHQPGEPEKYPDDENYPDRNPLAPFFPNKGKKPKDKIPQLLKPLLDKFPYKPKRPDDSRPDSQYPSEPEMYPDDEDYPIPDNHPSAPFSPNKGKKPTGKIPQFLKPSPKKSPYKPKRPDDSYPDFHHPDKPEMYPDDENYPIPDNHPLAPFLPNKGKIPTGKIPELLKPLLDKFPYKPRRPDDSHPDSHYPNDSDMYPDDENYPIPDNHPLAPFLPNKGKKPLGKIPKLLKPLLDKFPYKPKRPDDSHPDSHYPNESEMYPDDENYPMPKKHPLAPFFPKKGKKPTGKIPEFLKPLYDKFPYQPQRPDDSYPDSHQSDIPKMYPDDGNNPIPNNHPLAPFLPNKGKKPTGKIPELLKPLFDKFPYKPKRPGDSHPDSNYPNESKMYPDDDNYPIPDNHPLAPFLPNKGKKPRGKIPEFLKPLLDKIPYKPKRPDDSQPDSNYPNESDMYPDDENYPIPDNHPLAPFLPNKGKKPKDKIPQLLKPSPKKSPYKPKRPDDSYPDSHHPDEPEMYPDDENYPTPKNHPLAPFLPKKGKHPTGKIPEFLKPLLDKFSNKPKRPDDFHPDSQYPNESKMYPDDENYPITDDNHPLTPFLPNKGKKPTGKIPKLLKPLLNKYPYQPKQPDDSNPDSDQPDEPKLYPDDKNYPIPDNHPLAPFLPKKGKRPTGKIPEFLKPLLDKYKPKRPDDLNPDSHYPNELDMYPDDENYPLPDNHPLAPFLPNKGKKPLGKIPKLLKPLLDKFPYKPKRPDDSNPDSHYPNDSDMYPDDENYPVPDNHPLAPFLPNKGKKPLGKIPKLLKPLLDKFPYKPKRPDDSHPDSHYPNDSDMYPEDENYPIPDNHPLAPFLPNKGKKPLGKIPKLLKPLLNKYPYKPKRPDDSHPDSHYPNDSDMYPDDENYPIPDNHPLAPFLPNKGKKPLGKIPKLLKPLLDKFPYKPKRPDDSHPDSHYPNDSDMYPDDENYPIPDNHPLAPFLPNKGKKSLDKIPKLLKPLLDKLPYKPKRPDDLHPNSHRSDEPEMYPDDENYPIPDNHPLAPFIPNKGKNPTGIIPQYLKPLLDKFPYKPKRPGDTQFPNKAIPQFLKPLPENSPYKPDRPDDYNPYSYYPDEPEMYPDDKNYPIPNNHPLSTFNPNKGKKPTGIIPQYLKPLLDKFPYKPKRPDDYNPDYHHSDEPEMYPENKPEKNTPPFLNPADASPFYPYKGVKPDLYPDYGNEPTPKNAPYGSPFYPKHGKPPISDLPEMLKPKKYPHSPKGPAINPDEPDDSDYELNVVNDDYLQIYKSLSEVKSKISKAPNPNNEPDNSPKEYPCKLNSISDNEPADHSYKLPFKLERPLAGKKINIPKNFSDDSHEPSSDYISPLINTTSQYKPIILSDNSQEPQYFPLLGDEKAKTIPISFSDNSHEPLKLSFKPFDEKKPEYAPDSFSNGPNHLYQLTTPLDVNKPQYISNTLSDNSLEQPLKLSTPFNVLQPVYRPHGFVDNSLEQPYKISTPSDVKELDYRPISIYNNIPEQSLQFSTPLDVENPQYGPNSFSKNSHEQPFQDYTLINNKKPQYKPSSFSVNEPLYQSFRPLDDEKPRYAPYKLASPTPYEFSHELPLPAFKPQYKPYDYSDNNNVLYTKPPKLLSNGHEYIPGKGFGWHNTDNLPNNYFEMPYSSAPFTKTVLDIVPQDNIRSKELFEEPLNTTYSKKYKLGPLADGPKFPQRPDTLSEYNRGVNYMKGPKDGNIKLNAMKYRWLASDEQIKQFPVTPNSMMYT